MSALIENLHYNWTILLLLMLFINVLNSIFSRIFGKKFSTLDLRICLFGLIFSYFHLFISLTLYLIFPSFNQWFENTLINIIANNELRNNLVVNPLLFINFFVILILFKFLCIALVFAILSFLCFILFIFRFNNFLHFFLFLLVVPNNWKIKFLK